MYFGLKALSSFIKGQRLWSIITNSHVKPVQEKDKPQDKFDDCLDDWESKNYQIVTWFRAITIHFISLLFGRFQDNYQYPSPAKAIWDFLRDHYQTIGHAHQY